MLLDMCNSSEDPGSKKNLYGLNLLGIILSNDLIPWNDILLDDYINCLMKNTLENQDISILKTSSHVLGMSLKKLENIHGNEKIEYVEDKLKDTLKEWNHKKDDKYTNAFREILYGFSRSYPKFLKHFRTIIQSKIPSPNCIGKIKSMYMEMFLTSLDFFDEEDDLYAEITSIQLRKLLKSTDHQLLALHILNKSLPRMNMKQILKYIPEVENFCVTSKNVECRRLAYEFFMYIATNNPNHASRCQNHILKGFGDPDIETQNRIFEFWNDQLNEWNDTSKKLEQIIALGANTNCGKEFIPFCIRIILNPALKHNDANKNLLSVPLDETETKLTEYTINTKSKYGTSQHSLPYFAMDVSSKPHSFKPNSQKFEFIRATGNVDDNFFAPTQDIGNLSKTTQNFTMQSQTSMLFNVPVHILDNRSRISQTTISSSNEKFDKDECLNYLRSRHVKGIVSGKEETQLVDYSKRTKFVKANKVSDI